MQLFDLIDYVCAHIQTFDYRWMIVPGIGFSVYTVYKAIQTERRLPPGPIGFPWIGYTPCLGKDAFIEVQNLHKVYGHVVSFRLCGQLVVVFNDLASIRAAALDCRSWIGRHTMLTNHLLAGGYGISNYDGENATLMRRSFVRAIHAIIPSKVADRSKDGIKGAGSEYSFSKRLELLIDDKLDFECNKFISALVETRGTPVKINPLIRRMNWHVVWFAVFGIDCCLDDDVITELIQNIAENNAINGPFQIKQMLPNFLSYILSNSRWLRQMFNVDVLWNRYKKVAQIITEAVKEAKTNKNLPSTCLLAQFINNNEIVVSDSDLYRLAFELMAAGVDTTTLTMVWACNALATGQVHISPNEEFTHEHLNIVHRQASVVPMALPHTARYDNEVCGYYVPKGSVIFFNLFAVHQSQLRLIVEAPNTNEQPLRNSMCPMRSKTDENLEEQPMECPAAIPFSLGSRSCPGFSFAERLILRVLTQINSKFRVEPDNSEMGCRELHFGLTRSPASEHYRFSPL